MGSAMRALSVSVVCTGALKLYCAQFQRPACAPLRKYVEHYDPEWNHQGHGRPPARPHRRDPPLLPSPGGVLFSGKTRGAKFWDTKR
jgi:hypothetical protein